MSGIQGAGPTGPFGPRIASRLPDTGKLPLPEGKPGSAPERGGMVRRPPATDRLELGRVQRALPVLGSAGDMVRGAGGLSDLIQQALSRNLDRPVRLGRHAAGLVDFVAGGLAADGLSFEDLKRRLGS
ncbi:MAG: hypothetical protein FJY99_07810 [Candidatus Sericytochromatia bacterium]|nr:hypothetical protein [Candidatus Tanganyikabacteria bacterium]